METVGIIGPPSALAPDPDQPSTSGGFFSGLGGLILGAGDRLIDLEVLEREQRILDRGDIADRVDQRLANLGVQTTGFGDAITALSPFQIAGLGIAAALTFALLTGQFR